jgi:uncharacterized protein YcbK (DUF882 family)
MAKWSKAKEAAFAAKKLAKAKENIGQIHEILDEVEAKQNYALLTLAELEKLAKDKYAHEALLKSMQNKKESILQDLKDVEKTISFLENNSTFIQRELPALRCF